MASIRRTQSPASHDRSSPYLNGANNPFSLSSPSHKHLYLSFNYSNNKISILSTFVIGLKRFLCGIFLYKHSRKPNHVWKWSLYRFLLCFALGFLLGSTPFRTVDHGIGPPSPPPPLHHHLRRRQELRGVVRPNQRSNIVMEAVNLGAKPEEDDEDKFNFLPRKQLIFVTPTYNRALQAYYLNRLAQALRLVPPPLLWIVVEMNSASMETSEILRKAGVMFRHLVCSKNSTDVKDRGVHQRNTALEHITQHRLDGVVYFADDDNIYSLELFESLREISRFGTWPVAMLAQSKAKAILEGPICKGSHVIGWHTNEKSKRLRRFHVDMSGFAFNSTILWDHKRWNRTTSKPIRQLDTVKEGFQETTFIEQVVEDEFQMEGIPYGCSRAMNWHLHLDARNLVYPKGWLLQKNLDVVLPFE